MGERERERGGGERGELVVYIHVRIVFTHILCVYTVINTAVVGNDRPLGRRCLLSLLKCKYTLVYLHLQIRQAWLKQFSLFLRFLPLSLLILPSLPLPLFLSPPPSLSLSFSLPLSPSLPPSLSPSLLSLSLMIFSRLWWHRLTMCFQQ